MTPKEVAAVNSNTTQFWTEHTSGLGMPMCGCALGVITRDRAAAATKGQVAFVPSYVPGTNAWSPPVC
jgi:hypothetical protein